MGTRETLAARRSFDNSDRLTVVHAAVLDQSPSEFQTARCDRGCMKTLKSILQETEFMDGGVSSFIEKANNRLGDRAAAGILKLYGEKDLIKPRNIKTFLFVIRSAFEFPNLIDDPASKRPSVTIPFLEKLASRTSDADLQSQIADTISFVKQKAQVSAVRPDNSVAILRSNEVQDRRCASSTCEDNNLRGQVPLFVSDVRGRVIDEVAPRQPIGGVCMFLFDEESHKLSASAVADSSGSFKFEGSYWGSYRLLARANSRSIANIPLIIGRNARRARGQITIIIRAAHDNRPSYARFEPPSTPRSAESDDVIVDGWKMGDTTVFEQTLTMNLEKHVPVYEFNIDDSSRTKHFRLRLEQNFAHTARPLAVPCWTAVMSEVTRNANGADALGPNLLSREGPGTGDYFPRENNANFLCAIEKPTMLLDRGLYPVRTRRIFYVERFLVTLRVSDYVLNAKENRLDKLVLEIGLSNN